MSEKPNNINNLAQRARVLAILGGHRHAAPSVESLKTPAIAVGVVDVAMADDDFADGDDDFVDAPKTPTMAPDARRIETEAIAAPAVDGAHEVAAIPLPAASLSLSETALARRFDSAVKRIGREDLVASFLASRGSPKSRRAMLQGLERCARIWGLPVRDMPWLDLRLEHWLAIRAALIDANYRRNTLQSTLSSVRGLLTHAVDLELFDVNQLHRVTHWPKLVGEDLMAGRVLSEEEIDKLRSYCEAQAASGTYGVFLQAVFALLLGVGLRAAEACSLTVAGYDSAAKIIRVRRKRQKEAELPIDDGLKAMLDRWLALRLQMKRISSDAFLLRIHTNDWIRDKTPHLTVKTLEYLVDVVAEAAGVAKMSPHDLRRTFCTYLLDANKDTLTVSRLMSHASPTTTMRYDRRSKAADAAARASVRIW